MNKNNIRKVEMGIIIFCQNYLTVNLASKCHGKQQIYFKILISALHNFLLHNSICMMRD